MSVDQKGMFSSYTILTSFMTGGLFPFLGSVIALSTGAVTSLQWFYLILVVIGGFTAHWVLAHTIHDLDHYALEPRKTLSKKALKALMILSIIVLLSIAFYLTIQVGWPVLIFSIIGFIACLYGEGLLHYELQMAIAAFFLIIGAFYVQTGTLFLSTKIWLQAICMGMFGFFAQYGWLLFYRLDDYGWDPGVRNKSILISKIGIPFLIGYFLIGIYL